MKIIYYMPVFLYEQAKMLENKRLLDFCEIFKIVSPNACVIDRTGSSLETPFDFKVIDAIPERPSEPVTLRYYDLCIKRAADILKENKKITIFYSGGIDSSVVLLSFFTAIKAGIGSFDQVTVAASIFSIIENPDVWADYVLPNFRVISVNNAIDNLGNANTIEDRYVMGENADQLFGSDIVLLNLDLFNQKISDSNIEKYLVSRNVTNESMAYLLRLFNNLKSSANVELENMADLIWWLNFSCKWQSVSLRTLCFTDFLNAGNAESDLKRFGTFFNTPEFQILSLYGDFKKWGEPPSQYNYKLESRNFLKMYRGCEYYAENKIKVPSLYRILASESYRYNALGIDDGKIVKVDSIEIKL